MGQIVAQKRVWVDTDMAIGQKTGCFSYCDVDDAYALAVLLRSVEITVVGVSSTLGNTDDIERSTRTARNFIASYGPNSVSVYQGAGEKLPKDLSRVTTNAAVEQMAAALKEDRLTIMAIGAATNIAILLLKYPALESRIDEIVLVAGRRSMDQRFISGHWQPKPFRDLNFEFDTPAFEVLLQRDVPLTLVPFEVCHQVWIRPQDLIALGESGRLGKFLAEHALGWLGEWETVFGANGFNPFDMVAAGYLIQPEYFKWHQWNACIQEGPDDTDAEKTKPYLICSPDIKNGSRVNYCVFVDELCRELMLERLRMHDMSAFILGLSHVNVVVPSVAEATEYYARVLGFEQAFDSDGNKMDYAGVEMKPLPWMPASWMPRSTWTCVFSNIPRPTSTWN
ncbi:nucleoside hydrolase [Desulfosarcina cetonica]|uniref:nucleoside hydrolase n=1 Tax=Desulfosarcina cetonica TaxID=90730 RepID=UPI001C49569F|nr:nucleoside hydrolase [Desulfosarcina cetonica]